MYNKILHLIHTPRFSGAEMLVRDLCAIHQQKGIETAIASFAPAQDDFVPTLKQLANLGVRLYIPKEKLSGMERSRYYRMAYESFVPDIVYGQSSIPSFYGRLALPFWGARPHFVSVLHSANNDDYKSATFNLSELIMTLRATSIFAVSQQGAENYKKRIPYARNVKVVPNGAHLSKIKDIKEPRSSLREKLGLQPTDKLILQVGRISDMKQQILTLEALLPLLERDPKVKIWFAGVLEDVGYVQELSRMIGASSAKDRVALLGGRNDIPNLLNAADVFVMPSLREAHSLAMIEALASGVFVAASDIPSFRFAEKLPGVKLFQIGDREAFADAVTQFLLADDRHNRDMSNFDIERVAAIYGGYA